MYPKNQWSSNAHHFFGFDRNIFPLKCWKHRFFVLTEKMIVVSCNGCVEVRCRIRCATATNDPTKHCRVGTLVRDESAGLRGPSGNAETHQAVLQRGDVPLECRKLARITECLEKIGDLILPEWNIDALIVPCSNQRLNQSCDQVRSWNFDWAVDATIRIWRFRVQPLLERLGVFLVHRPRGSHDVLFLICRRRQQDCKRE